MDADNDLLSASLEAIESGKRAEKFQRFFTDFQREFDTTLNNVQEWIKAELPIVANDIDLAVLKEKLKSNKTSARRKHLLSALIFERATRYATHKHQAATAALMAMHMINHIWQAKFEMNLAQPDGMQSEKITKVTKHQQRIKSKAKQEFSLKREQILTSLIKKGEHLKSNSQIQKQNSSAIQANQMRNPTPQDKQIPNLKQKDLWAEAAEKEKLNKRALLAKDKKFRRKTLGVFSKVRGKIPLKRNNKQQKVPTEVLQQPNLAARDPSDRLLDNPNDSAIIMNPGLAQSMDGYLAHNRPRFSNDPNESGITVHKMLKKHEHETHVPGSNTIIRKLASSMGKNKNAELTMPERCQQVVNELCQQFPSYDLVAIRNMAAKKIGVSSQYIENLNILPESTT